MRSHVEDFQKITAEDLTESGINPPHSMERDVFCGHHHPVATFMPQRTQMSTPFYTYY
jgi:hypothetical protein